MTRDALARLAQPETWGDSYPQPLPLPVGETGVCSTSSVKPSDIEHKGTPRDRGTEQAARGAPRRRGRGRAVATALSRAAGGGVDLHAGLADARGTGAGPAPGPLHRPTSATEGRGGAPRGGRGGARP